MQNHVEINVSRNNRHVFATAPRSGTGCVEDIVALLDLIESKFPESEGYKVSATYWQSTGKPFKR